MERVALRSQPLARAATCWHCGRDVAGRSVARYLYPGELPRVAIVEDWHHCACGAYQNVRRATEITVSPVARA
jgi:sarcosine oxidase delta subunit